MPTQVQILSPASETKVSDTFLKIKIKINKNKNDIKEQDREENEEERQSEISQDNHNVKKEQFKIMAGCC